MKTKDEFIEFVRGQLDWDVIPEYYDVPVTHSTKETTRDWHEPLKVKEEGVYTHDLDSSTRKNCWHYGRCELKELMDFIYDGEDK